MRHGLPRKLRIAFILQAVMVSLAIVLGVYLVSAVIKHSLMNTALQEEAAHFWELYSASTAQPPPNTHNLRGYLVVKGHSNLVLPENLRELRPGFHELKDDDLLVLVDEQPAGRLYLVFLRSQAERLAFYFGTVPIIMTLVAIYLVSWLTYRASKRLVSPVSWLARQVAEWDPRRPAHVARERDFTRDASHELRTPLTVIRVASDMAMAEDSPPRVARALQRIQRAGRDMEAVIDAFLILAREAEVEPQSEDFDVADIVMDEAENARALLLNKPVDLEVTLHARPRLHAPPRVFQVVVSNLLRNACSYTDRGRIDVILEPDRVIVRDTGIGMSAESMVRVFEPFYRADPSRPQGSGLGLSIVSRLCDRFGWKIELDSELGRGTTATIRFVP